MPHLRGHNRNLINWRATAFGPATVTGNLSVTLDPVTLSAAGTVPVAGSLTKTLADVVLTADGANTNFGDLSQTLSVLLSAAGTIPVNGDLSQVLTVLLSATGSIPANGALSKTLDAMVLSAAGQVFNPTVAGDLSVVLAAITLLAQGTKRFPQPPNNLVAGPLHGDFWQTHDFPEIL